MLTNRRMHLHYFFCVLGFYCFLVPTLWCVIILIIPSYKISCWSLSSFTITSREIFFFWLFFTFFLLLKKISINCPVLEFQFRPPANERCPIQY